MITNSAIRRLWGATAVKTRVAAGPLRVGALRTGALRSRGLADGSGPRLRGRAEVLAAKPSPRRGVVRLPRLGAPLTGCLARSRLRLGDGWARSSAARSESPRPSCRPASPRAPFRPRTWSGSDGLPRRSRLRRHGGVRAAAAPDAAAFLRGAPAPPVPAADVPFVPALRRGSRLCDKVLLHLLPVPGEAGRLRSCTGVRGIGRRQARRAQIAQALRGDHAESRRALDDRLRSGSLRVREAERLVPLLFRRGLAVEPLELELALGITTWKPTTISTAAMTAAIASRTPRRARRSRLRCAGSTTARCRGRSGDGAGRERGARTGAVAVLMTRAAPPRAVARSRRAGSPRARRHSGTSACG